MSCFCSLPSSSSSQKVFPHLHARSYFNTCNHWTLRDSTRRSVSLSWEKRFVRAHLEWCSLHFSTIFILSELFSFSVQSNSSCRYQITFMSSKRKSCLCTVLPSAVCCLGDNGSPAVIVSTDSQADSGRTRFCGSISQWQLFAPAKSGACAHTQLFISH